MLTFKQFLLEGGKATEKYGTVRATQSDMKVALEKVSKVSGLPLSTLEDRLLGSARLTYAGKQKDSGDIDIAVSEKEIDRDAFVKKLTDLAGHEPHVTGGDTYSFAIDVGDRKIQVDIMFVSDVKWAKFSHHASEKSAHKSGVRNELLHSALKYSMQPGKDLRIKDESGNDIVRASRAYKLTDGVERIFKIAPMRKDGAGRVKGVVKATPAEVQKVLDEIGHTGKFSKEPDVIRDPDEFAKLLFGPSVKADDLHSTESVIELIKKHKPKNATDIFIDAVKGIKRLKLPIPTELAKFK